MRQNDRADLDDIRSITPPGNSPARLNAAGYDKGKSDAVKLQYWLYVSMQRQRNHVASVRLYPVQLPEQRIDGVTFQPSTKYLRIEE